MKRGTDRVFEVFQKTLNSNPNIIVNLQGDMPNIEPEAIKNLINYGVKDRNLMKAKEIKNTKVFRIQFRLLEELEGQQSQ